MILTTTEHPPEPVVEQAIRLAVELQIPFVPRLKKSIKALLEEWDAKEVIVVSRSDVRLLTEGQAPLFFHPSMALVRLKRLLSGGTDLLVELSAVKAGDTIIDCTAGLCSDALVLKFAAGSTGRVVAIEGSRLLHVIVREGLRTYKTGLPEVDEALRGIETVYGEHDQCLQQMGDKSADIVYFDPMFDKPIASSSHMIPLRTKAIDHSLSLDTIKQAIRVARKKVILKDHRASGQFERLGFNPLRKSSSAVSYGVINIEE